MTIQKPVIIILTILTVVILFAAAVNIIIRNPGLIYTEPPGPCDSLTNDEVMEINEGDLVLIQGQGLPSDFIILILDEEIKISHIGFVIIRDNEPWVIHTVNSGLSGIDGIQMHNINDFISHASENTVVISRPKWQLRDSTYTIRNNAARLAEELYSRKIPFDNDYNSDNEDELYCTELILLLLKNCGFWPEELKIDIKGPFILFGNFVKPEYFDIIIDHRKKI